MAAKSLLTIWGYNGLRQSYLDDTIHPFCLEFPVGYAMLHYQPHMKKGCPLSCSKSSQGLGHAVAAAGSAGAGGDLLYVGHVGDADQDLQDSASEMAKGGYTYSFYYIFTLW